MNACKFCGESLTLRWCGNPNCPRFVSTSLKEIHEDPLRFQQAFRVSDEPGFCGECTQTLSFTSLTNPCPKCLRNEPETVLKRFDQVDKDAIRSELGLAEGLEDREVVVDGSSLGRLWNGYQAVLWGVVLGHFSSWTMPAEGLDFYRTIGGVREERGKTFLTPGLMLPFATLPILDEPDLIVKLCRIRIHYLESPLYSEMRFHDYGANRISIQGWEYGHTQKDLKNAIKGLGLLHRAFKKIGRRGGGETRTLTQEQFLEKAPMVCRHWKETHGNWPTDAQLAGALFISTSTLYNYMRDDDLSMQSIRRLADRNTTSSSPHPDS